MSHAEWHFIQSLAYPSQLSRSHRFEPESDTQRAESPETPLPETQDAEFIRLIYTARLRKYHHAEEHQTARTKLVEEVCPFFSHIKRSELIGL
jgi:hypothetical protein